MRPKAMARPLAGRRVGDKLHASDYQTTHKLTKGPGAHCTASPHHEQCTTRLQAGTLPYCLTCVHPLLAIWSAAVNLRLFTIVPKSAPNLICQELHCTEL